MSATAKLFTSKNPLQDFEPPAAFAPSGFYFGDGSEPGLAAPDRPVTDWDGVVDRYEPRLNAANGAVLHIGAGSGELMEALRQHGFLVMGCEPAPLPAQWARESHGFDTRTLQCSSAESFLRWTRRIGQKAQAIFFRHDLEHCLELQALLPALADALHGKGLLIAQLPPPSVDHPREAHLSFLQELAVACTSCGDRFEIAGVDCDFESGFMAFVLRKTPSPD